MDKRKGILNILSSIISRISLCAVALFVRRMLIQNIGNDVNGLNSLYSSILGLLAVAELGVGSAITFSMYKPIVKGNQKSVAALYCLYKKLYRIIGIVILIAGLVILPFLPYIISDYSELSIDVYFPFLLTLVSVVLTYFYGAKTSLIQAHKYNYLTTGILTIASLVRYGLQIITIKIWSSYTLYLGCQIIETLVIWILTDSVVRMKYKDILEINESLDETSRSEIVKNIKAAFLHKTGTALVNTIDSILISSFIGVVILGKYANYTLIIGVIVSVITLFFNPLTSVVGHLYASGNLQDTKRWFDFLYSLNYFLGVIFFLGYFAVIDYVVRLCFGSGLELSRSITFIITLNQFTYFMRRTALLFRDASGTFYYDRWKPIGEGICNLVLSLIFVNVFSEEYRIVGVIVATIITTLGICHIVDPFVVYKHVFKTSVKEYYLRNYCYIGLFTVALLSLSRLLWKTDSVLAGIIVNGIISVGVSSLLLGLVAIVDKSFRNSIITLNRKTIVWVKQHYL